MRVRMMESHSGGEVTEAQCPPGLNGMQVSFSLEAHSFPVFMPEDSLTITLFSLIAENGMFQKFEK